MRALLALERLRLMRGRSLWLGLGLGLLIAAFGVWARHASGEPQAIEKSYDLGLSHLLAYLLPYLFSTGMIAEEVRGRTLGYLTSRPVARSQILIAKWAVAAGASAGVLSATCLILHLGCFALDPGELIARLPTLFTTAGALALQAAAYAALGLCYGVVAPRAASALFAFHLLLVEATLSLAPGSLRLLSLAHHAAELAGLPRHGAMTESVRDLPPAAHVAVLCAGCCLWLALGCARFAHAEYHAGGSD